MPPKISRSDIGIFCAIVGGFALVVVFALIFGGLGRALGTGLIFLGVCAIVFSRAVARAKDSIGERTSLWPGRNDLRPFTIQLWGLGLFVLGLVQVLGF